MAHQPGGLTPPHLRGAGGELRAHGRVASPGGSPRPGSACSQQRLLFSPRPTSSTSGSCTWRAGSWPTTPRLCPYWPSTPSRTGRPPGRTPLLHGTLSTAAPQGPSSRGTHGLGTPASAGADPRRWEPPAAVARPQCPLRGRAPFCRCHLGPHRPCATPRSGSSAGRGTGRLTRGPPSQVGPGRALQVQVQPPRGPARRRRQLVGPQEAGALLPAGHPRRAEGLLPGAGVAIPRAAVGAAPGLRADP